MVENSNYLPDGTLLDYGHYRIERVLGQGGFGITYLAMDTTLGRKVAIKEFFPKDFCNRDSVSFSVSVGTAGNRHLIGRLRQKFVKEAQNLAKLNHPNIIKIQTIFEENETAYYVMDYIEGNTLAELVRANGPMADSLAIHYIKEIGEALEYIHSKNINHLDVKPANIMVRRHDNMPILIDFGLSKQYDSEGMQTSTTPTGISHGYAPPEQYADGGVKEFSPKTDLYSLAATFYYLLTATVPPKSIELLNESLNFPPSFPRKYLNAVYRAMSPIKSGRQDTVRKFLQELETDYVNFPHQNNRNEEATTIYAHKPRPIFRDESYVDYDDDDDNEKSTGLKIFYTILILILLGVVGFVGYKIYVSLNSQNHKVIPPREAENEEIITDDWDEYVPPEELIDDRRDFTSPDMDIFNVHGPVKSIQYTSKNTLPINEIYGPIRFDRTGNWENIGNVLYSNAGIAVDFKKQKGKLFETSGIIPEDDLGSYENVEYSFEWNGDRLKKIIESRSFSESEEDGLDFIFDYGIVNEFNYYGDNFSSIEYESYSDTYSSVRGIWNISNFKYDDYGNWTSCMISEYEETILFDVNYEEIQEPYDKNANSQIFYITREIEYY